MLHIKLKRIKCRTTGKEKYCPYIPCQLLGWDQMVKTFFSESGHAVYQIKRK